MPLHPEPLRRKSAHSSAGARQQSDGANGDLEERALAEDRVRRTVADGAALLPEGALNLNVDRLPACDSSRDFTPA